MIVFEMPCSHFTAIDLMTLSDKQLHPTGPTTTAASEGGLLRLFHELFPGRFD